MKYLLLSVLCLSACVTKPPVGDHNKSIAANPGAILWEQEHKK